MSFFMSLLLLGLVLGLIVVASNPSPYFAALGLVVAAGVGCGILVWHGGSFLCFILFLIYLGGMLVVFAYCAALAADSHWESLGSQSVAATMLVYGVSVGVLAGGFYGGWYESSWLTVEEFHELAVHRGDAAGVALMYMPGGKMLMIAAWTLLLTLFVVMELVRGKNRGALRSI
ncbi:NADH dehydrogenase subunit 6 (mitochondrion) [Sparus aurata]|uniref:NADH-ubiquinone oxidoreductase chain 6 n=2 Tax=Sparidae TaxID=8169 RepID=A0A060VD67_SPAAU|nr:NADH dehydrogenase subunit 6 [Sparus aurata]AGV76767.1 NADH-ubiquinone oxidoreductase chain 6 [Sparus aurata]ALO64190.1 NADH dehydrogenase subunit 6 [Sparus aurata]CDQ52022.1 NADH dehydrogenase subunit 6 [Sparus aurata]